MTKKSFFDKEPRTYTVADGKVYPSVTEVLGIMDKSGPLMGWALKECGNFILNEATNLYESALTTTDENDKFFKTLEKTVKMAKVAHREKSQKALDIGTRVHKIVHDIGLGLPVLIEKEAPEVRKGVEAYSTWVKQTGYVGLEHEFVVYSDELETAGTLDSIGLVGGTLTLLDWKTSKAIYDEYLIQAAVYAYAYEERTGKSIRDAWIVRFDKETGIPEEKLLTNREKHLDCFRGLRAAWQWKQDMKGVE